ncbi:hypothetical protein [Kitasatospora aureofaciens]|uniref:hypothetical protein n=1 Tax=Kitasatospora aureofaciens TaxID=1894 RepID=UPI00131AC77A|nr:hypothetical protein [Kitasatospora aureofaciens]
MASFLIPLLTASAFTALVTTALVAVCVIVTAWLALKGTRPAQRATILRAVADIARALRGNRR